MGARVGGESWGKGGSDGGGEGVDKGGGESWGKGGIDGGGKGWARVGRGWE